VPGITNKITTPGRRIAGGIVRRLKRARQKLVRLDRDKINLGLRELGPFTGDTLFVHSSLSACGYIEGGPETVVQALREWISEGKTLAMPTHTWSYPDESGVAPLYDYKSTPSVVGAITNHFWRGLNVTRSLHPSHSMAANGPDSVGLLSAHEHSETPCGQGTPYSRMVQGNSSVLMFGATMDAYTLFHTAEDEAQVPYLYSEKRLTLRTKRPDGSIQEIPTWRQDMTVTRRFAAMAPWLEDQRLMVRRRLGRGELLFIPDAGVLHERLITELRCDPFLLVAESIRSKISSHYSSPSPKTSAEIVSK
jgi:aminoglycoside 3-N-acetyltransferase